MPTETELALEQTQQGASYEVSAETRLIHMLSETPKLLSGIEDSHYRPSNAMHNPPQPLKVSQKPLVSFLIEITLISIDFLTPSSEFRPLQRLRSQHLKDVAFPVFCRLKISAKLEDVSLSIPRKEKRIETDETLTITLDFETKDYQDKKATRTRSISEVELQATSQNHNQGVNKILRDTMSSTFRNAMPTLFSLANSDGNYRVCCYRPENNLDLSFSDIDNDSSDEDNFDDKDDME
ncbi:hypothetical protein Tco_0606003 [Tanacetum coccineum]